MKLPVGGCLLPGGLDRDTELNATDLRVAIFLGQQFENGRWTEVNQESLGAYMTKARPTINAALQKLVARGWAMERGRSCGLRTKLQYRLKLDTDDETFLRELENAADVSGADNGKQTMSVGLTTDVGEADNEAKKPRKTKASADVSGADNARKVSPTPPSKESTPPKVQNPASQAFELTPSPAADPDKRGTRLPADWRPTAALCREMKAELSITDEEIDAHVREFVDYWTGVPGARGKKLSWEGAFRNRLREQDRLGRLRRRSPARGGGTPASRVRDRLRAASAGAACDGGAVIDVEPIRRTGGDQAGD